MGARDHVLFREDFNLAAAINSSATLGAGLGVISTGTPTGAAVVTPGSTGEQSFTLANTNEEERSGFSFLDKLVFDYTKVKQIEFGVKVSGTLTSVQTFVCGIVGTGNKDFTAMNGCMLAIDGNSTPNYLFCRTKNSTATVSQVSTKQLSTSMMRLLIDLQDRRNVKFYAGTESDGNFVRLLPNPTAAFDFSAFTGGLQPYAHIYKSGGTTTPAFTCDYVEVRGIR